MSDKQFELYRTIQIDAGAVSYNLNNVKSDIESSNLDPQTKDAMLKVCDSMITTADDLAILISKTAQLIFKK